MASSPTVSLFTERTDLTGQPTSFIASIVIHCGVSGLLWFGIAYTPQINTHVVTSHYTVRHIDLRMPDQQLQRIAKGAEQYPGPRLPAGKSAAGKKDAKPAVLREVAHADPGPQTLIQPDLPEQVKLKVEVPVPLAVLWTPSKAPVKDIVPPQPEQPTASDVTPSLERPNEETNLADVNLAAISVDIPKLPILATTTSPVVVHNPDEVQLPPQTVSQPTAKPTPAAVMSLSNLQMVDGAAALPPVNETARTDAPGELAPGEPRDLPGAGNGTGTGTGTGAGSGGGSDAAAAASATAAGDGAATAPKAPGPEGQPKGTDSANVAGAESGMGQSFQPSATAITLPRDGRFSAVVVGDSLQDQFPEMADVWSGRMAYTVYLHVGLARSWILQYSIPRTEEASAAGNIAHLDPPWPYNIVRPNLGPGAIAADALMVHGIVNQSGRFETLTIVFPQAFAQAAFVISALEQWQFRPAMQNGQGIAVEVLLIIPEELN